MGFTRRQRVALLLAGAMLAVGGMAVLGALPSDSGDHVENVTVHAADGPAVTVQGETRAELSTLFPDTNTVDLRTTDGNATFSSNGRTNVTVQPGDITGTQTHLSGLDVETNNLTVDPEDKLPITVGGGAETLSWRDAPTIDDGTTDFSYSAPSTDATVAIGGLPSNTLVAAVDPNTGTTLDTTQTDGSGTATFDALDTGTHDVRIQSASGPTLSDPAPTGDLSAAPSQLEVNVSDPDFPGDSVNVEFFLDGNSVGTDTVTSSGTASTSISPPMAGEHTWYVEATDDAGATTTLDTQTFRVPDTLYIRNESAPNTLVDNVDVTITWYGESVVEERTSNDGTINMTGLPPEDFYVSIEADGYNDRTVYIDTLYQQREIFLLPENVTSVETRFVLNDVTGQFDESARLVVERALNVSGSNQYRRIAADQFGTEGVQTTLEQGVRYRLTVVAEDGTTQDLGPYRATTSETVTVVPGSPAVELDTGADGWVSAATIDNDTIVARYLDDLNRTDSVTLTVYERGNESNVLLAPTTYTSANDISTAISLTANQTDKEWVVSFEVTRDGETFTTTHIVANQRTSTGFNGLDGKWSSAIAIFILVLFAGAFSVVNRAAGAIMTGLMGGLLWWFGWLSGITSAAAIALYLFVAIIYSVYLMQRP